MSNKCDIVIAGPGPTPILDSRAVAAIKRQEVLQTAIDRRDERIRLLEEALRGILDNPYDSCPACDFGFLRYRATSHWDKCQFAKAKALLKQESFMTTPQNIEEAARTCAEKCHNAWFNNSYRSEAMLKVITPIILEAILEAMRWVGQQSNILTGCGSEAQRAGPDARNELKGTRQPASVIIALAELVAKLELIHADSRYQGVWTLYSIHGGSYSGPKYDKELEAAKAALKSATAEAWIPVSERLPEPMIDVLCSGGKSGWVAYRCDDKWICRAHGLRLHSITHWQPLLFPLPEDKLTDGTMSVQQAIDPYERVFGIKPAEPAQPARIGCDVGDLPCDKPTQHQDEIAVMQSVIDFAKSETAALREQLEVAQDRVTELEDAQLEQGKRYHEKLDAVTKEREELQLRFDDVVRDEAKLVGVTGEISRLTATNARLRAALRETYDALDVLAGYGDVFAYRIGERNPHKQATAALAVAKALLARQDGQ